MADNHESSSDPQDDLDDSSVEEFTAGGDSQNNNQSVVEQKILSAKEVFTIMDSKIKNVCELTHVSCHKNCWNSVELLLKFETCVGQNFQKKLVKCW